MEYRQNNGLDRQDIPMEHFLAMGSGSDYEESPLLPMNNAAPGTMDTSTVYVQPQRSFSAVEPENGTALNEELFDFHRHDMPGDLNYSPQWSPVIPFGPYGWEISNGEFAESSDYYGPELLRFQTGINGPHAGFDVISDGVISRVPNQTPFSSAGVFESSTLPLLFENMSPEWSPPPSVPSSQASHPKDFSRAFSEITTPPPESNRRAFLPTYATSSSAPTTPSRHLDPINTRPFGCPYQGCTRSYARKFELYRHQKRHTGIKSHHCRVPGCDRDARNGFYRKDHLKQHMRQVHGT